VSIDVDDLLAEGVGPPLTNGELIFETPWQGRVFGMARALADAGVFQWDEFRACLIEEIGGWDRHPRGEFAYYDHFLEALERLLAQQKLVEPEHLKRLTEALAARPHGHDHDHAVEHPHHDHDHAMDHPHHGHDHSAR
jgi:nitrile hydratase accessory protein